MGKNIPDYTLDHPRVQQAKRRFIKNQQGKTKSQLNFDELFGLYRSDLSYAEIGRRAGISTTAAAKKGDQYFKPFFGGLNGKERRHISVMRARGVRKLGMTYEFSTSTLVQGITRRACMYGARVERLVAVEKSTGALRRPYHSRLRVNWRVCVINRAGSIFRKKLTTRAYIRWNIYLKTVTSCDAIIVRIEEPGQEHRFLVLPSTLLYERVFRSCADRGHKLVLIPLGDRKANPSVARLNFWQYEDAWHLLKPPDVQENPPT